MASIEIRSLAGSDDSWWQNAPLADSGQRQQPTQYGNAISSVESGGRYDALGPVTRSGDRAYGKYQVMGANIGPWTQEILGRPLSAQEFVASPEAQDAVFNAKFGSYVQKYGPEGAAKAWFAGERGMNNPNARDILGTSVAGYADKFNKALGYAPESQAAPQRAALADDWWKSAPLASVAAPKATDISAASRAPQEPTVSMGEAIGRGVGQGATFNFHDELRGVLAAGGGKIDNPNEPAGLHNLVVGAYKLLASGDPEAKRIYEETVSKEREANKRAAEERPYSTLAGNLAGAVAIPVGGALSAATLGGRMGRGLAVGAGTGALYGAGEGESAEDRASKAAGGMLLGGAVGAAAPPVIAAIGKGVSKIAEPIANKVRGIFDPDAEASRRVFSAIKSDVDSGGGGLTPGELLQARAAGTPAATLDMGGETTRALARSAANTNSAARADLKKLTNDRFSSQGVRATDFISGLVRTPANANTTREALQSAADKYREPFYRRAYKDGSGGIWDSELQHMMDNSPVMQQAAKDAIASIRNKVAAGRAMSPLSPSEKPTLEFWDQVQRSLRGRYEALRKSGNTEEMADVAALRRALVDKLDKEVPSFATARGVASELFKAGDALEAGEKFVHSNINLGEVGKALSKMGPEERELFREGFVSKLIEDIRATGDRRNIMNKLNGSALARQKLNMALGPEGAAKVEAFVRVENIMDRAREAVSGNSTTAQQLLAAGLAGGSLGAYQTGDLTSPVNIVYAILGGGARYGGIKINDRLTRKIAETLVSNDPQVLKRGLDMFSKNKTMMQTLRGADNYLARIAGQESPKGALPLQSLSAGRAEDQ